MARVRLADIFVVFILFHVRSSLAADGHGKQAFGSAHDAYWRRTPIEEGLCKKLSKMDTATSMESLNQASIVGRGAVPTVPHPSCCQPATHDRNSAGKTRVLSYHPSNHYSRVSSTRAFNHLEYRMKDRNSDSERLARLDNSAEIHLTCLGAQKVHIAFGCTFPFVTSAWRWCGSHRVGWHNWPPIN